MALCTLQEAKDFQSITGDDDNDTLTLLIVLASEFIQTECGRRFAQATYTDYYSGNGTIYLPLRHRPVRSITSIHLDNSGYFGQADDPFPASTLLTAGTDYTLNRDDPVTADAGVPYSKSGLVNWIGGSSWFVRGGNPYGTVPGLLSPGIVRHGWPRGDGNIKVVYVAGWLTADIPSDLKMGTLLLVQTLKSQTDNNRFQTTSEGLGPHSFSYGQLTYYAREVYGFAQMVRKYRELAI